MVSFKITIQTNTIHLMPNISRKKSNQEMKFGQLIEYNMGDLLEKPYSQNVVEKLVPDPFIKNQNCVYLWINFV